MSKNPLFEALASGIENGLFDDIDNVGSDEEYNSRMESVFEAGSKPAHIIAKNVGGRSELEIKGNVFALMVLMGAIYDGIRDMMKEEDAALWLFDNWMKYKMGGGGKL